MEIEPEGLESNLETGVLRKNRLKHYLAVAALLALGCAVVWFLASLQMYSNWERGIAPEANVYYATVGCLFILLGGSGPVRSGSLTKRVIAAGVFGLGLGAFIQYIQLGTTYIDFWW